jgi:hypothetical protein
MAFYEPIPLNPLPLSREGGVKEREGGFAPLSKISSPSPTKETQYLRNELDGEGDKGGEVKYSQPKKSLLSIFLYRRGYFNYNVNWNQPKEQLP